MPAAVPSFERSFGFVLSDITRLARREFDRRVRHLRLTRAQWLFLYYVARQPGSTQVELAEAMQMEKITVGRQAVRLLRAGWIRRRDHQHDGRAYKIFLTPKADRVVRQLGRYATQLRNDYMRGIAPARQAALLDELLHIKSNLLRMETRSRSA